LVQSRKSLLVTAVLDLVNRSRHFSRLSGPITALFVPFGPSTTSFGSFPSHISGCANLPTLRTRSTFINFRQPNRGVTDNDQQGSKRCRSLYSFVPGQPSTLMMASRITRYTYFESLRSSGLQWTRACKFQRATTSSYKLSFKGTLNCFRLFQLFTRDSSVELVESE